MSHPDQPYHNRGTRADEGRVLRDVTTSEKAPTSSELLDALNSIGDAPTEVADLVLTSSASLLVDAVHTDLLGTGIRVGQSLLDIVDRGNRAPLRSCIESALASGGRHRVVAGCAHDPRQSLALTVWRPDTTGAAVVHVSGVALPDATGAARPVNGLRVDWLRQLVDELPIPVFFKDVEGRYLHVNPAFAEEYAAPSPRRVDELIGTTDHDHLHTPEADDYRHRDAHVLAGASLRDHVDRVVRPDGGVDLYESSKVPLKDRGGRVVGLMGFARPVTDSAAVSAELEKSERRYRLALRASRDGIWEFDPQQVTIELSERACQMLDIGVVAEPIPVADVLLRMQQDAGRDLIRAIEQVVHDPTATVSVRFPITLNDVERWLQLDGAALTEDGRTVRIIGSMIDVSDAVRAETELVHRATHDDLTDLPNRRALTEALERALADERSSHALLFLDLDDFKHVNDTLGHQAGDDLLLQVANRLRDAVGPDDLVVRLGGDEFAVLVAENRQGSRGRSVADALVGALIRPHLVAGAEVRTPASVGVVALDGYCDAEAALRDADTAMYAAKASSASTSIFDSSMRRAAPGSVTYAGAIHAIREQELALVYQPIMRLDTAEVTAIEAFVRWNRPGDVVVRPVIFLPDLLGSGDVRGFTRWSLDEACSQLVRWRAEGRCRSTRVGVNLAVPQLLDPHVRADIADVLALHRLEGSDVMIDVPIAVFGDERRSCAELVRGLRSTGIAAALDDVPLDVDPVMLEHADIDVVKIDGGVIEQAIESDDHRLERLLALCRARDIEVVAERVATEDQADRLMQLGCDSVQGHAVARPRFGNLLGPT